MIFDAIYLLIYNNLQCLYTKEYLIEFVQTLLLLMSIYTLPIYIFELDLSFFLNHSIWSL